MDNRKMILGLFAAFIVIALVLAALNSFSKPAVSSSTSSTTSTTLGDNVTAGNVSSNVTARICYTISDIKAEVAAGKHLIIIEGIVYDITPWANDTVYPPSLSLLRRDINDSERWIMDHGVGAICPAGLEDIYYNLTVGASETSFDFVSALLNKSVDDLKEYYKQTGNEKRAWHLTTRTRLVLISDVCDKNADLILTDMPPSDESLTACGRKAFVSCCGAEKIYIIRGDKNNKFIETVILRVMATPGYELIQRYQE